MIVIEADNVCDALCQGVSLLDNQGWYEDSRAGVVVVAESPVMTVTANPCERVLFSPVRDANPFFHLAEALWMLAGRNDSAFLDRYVSDFSKRYAEDDGVIHGAYGWRWQHAFNIDQISVVINKLRNNPNDRQCVIQMWDARQDLQGTWKDRPCNTHIYLRVQTTGHLDLTVCCRSNDAIWGAHGSNAVHFSILQEYIARNLGLKIGKMYQLSNNYHAYADVIENIWGRSLEDNRYRRDTVRIERLDYGPDFDNELKAALVLYPPSKSRWLIMAHIMLVAHQAYKSGNTDKALDLLSQDNIDWFVAGREWITRRIERWVNKGASNAGSKARTTNNPIPHMATDTGTVRR